MLLNKVFNKIYNINVEQLTEYDFSEPTIIMPNHTSLLDAIILASNLPKEVYFVVNTEAAHKYQWIVKHRNHIMVDTSNPYSVRKMIETLNKNIPLVIFPEGRITTTGGLMKIYDGLSYIAMKTNANIYCVSIIGAEKSKLSYIQGKTKTFLFPSIRMRVGMPFKLNIKDDKPMSEKKKKASRDILIKMQNELFEAKNKTNINLYNELLIASSMYGKNLEIIEDIGQRISYKNLLIAVNVFSVKMKELLLNEKNVGVLLPNAVGNYITLFSLFQLNKTPAMLNFSMNKQMLKESCETAGVKTILTSKVFIDKGGLQDVIYSLSDNFTIIYLEDIKKDITKKDKIKGLLQYILKTKSTTDNNEIILFTSGTESKPKGVVLSHDNIYANLMQISTMFDFTSKDKIMNVLPMFHSFGLTAGAMLPVLLGIPVFAYPSPLHYKEIPELIYDKNATIMFGTSTFLAGYAKYADNYDFHALRYVVAGAEKLKDEVRHTWLDKFGIRVLEGYGATETAPVLAVNSPKLYKKNTVGTFLPGIEYKINQVEGIQKGGELLVKGPNIMKGYLIHGEGFKPLNDWYNTGDIVDIDEDGFVTIESRLKRFAKIGGEMVSLNLVETLLERCYKESFYSVSISDKKKGEQIIAFSTINVDKKEFIKYAKTDDIPKIMIPSNIHTIEAIPLLGSGKTDYVSLQKMAQQIEEDSGHKLWSFFKK